MTGIKLSRRLQQIANFVPASSRIADIGSDHGLLACFLVAEGIADMAVAGEVAEGPFCSTKKQVKECGLDNIISVRLGDGLSVIDGNIDVVIIAGMGGELIVKILSQGKPKLSGVRRLVLQPNVDEEKLRKWLYANGWEIVDEDVVKDKRHFYEIIVAEQACTQGAALTALEYLVGPVNLEMRTLLFHEKWERELAKREKILRGLKNAQFSAVSWLRRRETKKQYRLISQLLKLLNS